MHNSLLLSHAYICMVGHFYACLAFLFQHSCHREKRTAAIQSQGDEWSCTNRTCWSTTLAHLSIRMHVMTSTQHTFSPASSHVVLIERGGEGGREGDEIEYEEEMREEENVCV